MSLLNSQHLSFGVNSVFVKAEITGLFYNMENNSH